MISYLLQTQAWERFACFWTCFYLTWNECSFLFLTQQAYVHTHTAPTYPHVNTLTYTLPCKTWSFVFVFVFVLFPALGIYFKPHAFTLIEDQRTNKRDQALSRGKEIVIWGNGSFSVPGNDLVLYLTHPEVDLRAIRASHHWPLTSCLSNFWYKKASGVIW